ncbi:MAG: integrase arm-type DNA-binding domain-containing protein [Rhodocyclaceae bacterium]|nr:integrase arm-type DNA-binding domain-containing protein [Rhodocyclaceae bacterium]
MGVTDAQIRTARAQENAYKLSDDNGLYLLATPGGSKLWRSDYSYEGKRKTLALGAYPEVSLASAREKLMEMRAELARGIDPSAARTARTAANDRADTFEVIAREWFTRFAETWAKSHSDKIIASLENDIFPWLGKRPIAEIEPPEMLECLRRIEDRGALDTAHRALQIADWFSARPLRQARRNTLFVLTWGALCPPRKLESSPQLQKSTRKGAWSGELTLFAPVRSPDVPCASCL